LDISESTGPQQILRRATRRGGERWAIRDFPAVTIVDLIYSYARGVSSARQISREMEHEPGLQWLAGMEVVNHHTLSDFRVVHGSALQNLMEQVLGVLFSEGLVGLERVTPVKNQQSIRVIREEVDRIDWALNEILPR
jgi:hypothetical protein